jgi:hypothetical protein
MSPHYHDPYDMPIYDQPHPYINTNIQEHVIQGEMIATKIELSISESIQFDTDDKVKEYIKEKLTHQLVNAILKNKLAEFTFLDDPLTGGKTIYGRCYLTPDSQVRIIRIFGGKK